MNKKLIASIATILCAGVTLLSVTACDSHKHTYGDEFTPCGETGHWHAATCGHDVDGRDFEEHHYGGWVTVTQATEESTGLRTRTCGDCGYVDEDIIEKILHEHTYAAQLTACGEAGHWYAATCGHDVDGRDFEEHHYGGWVVVEEETLSKTGLRTRTCDDCGYVDEDIIPVHVHNVPEKWYSNANSHWQKTDCGESHSGHSFEVNKAGHERKIEEQPATATEAGHYKEYCAVCGFVFKEFDIAPLGEGSSVSPFNAKDGTNEGETTTDCEYNTVLKDYVQYWIYTAAADGTVTLSVDENSFMFLWHSTINFEDAAGKTDYLEYFPGEPQYWSTEYNVSAGDVIYLVACGDMGPGAYSFNLTFTAE